jgi:molecular chaperone DnaK
VHVNAKDLGTGKEQKVDVQPTSGLSEEEITTFIAEAESNRAADMQKKEWADLRNNADTLIYGAERALEEFGTQVDAASKSVVQEQIGNCKRLLEAADDLDAAREAVLQLEAEAHKLFEVLQGAV